MSNEFRPPNLPLTVIGLALATFMQILDSTIANVSLPTIAGNLGASAQQGTWVVTAFSASMAIAMPLTGWMSKRLGEVRLFLLCTALFTLMSFMCGISRNMTTLIICRAIQGAVAGPLFPIVQTIMISIFPANKRSMALALVSMITIVAPILGPILGGWITDDYSWPWIFFINVPLGFIACFIVWTQMRQRPEVPQKIKMDYVGLITLVLWVGCLQVLLDTGNDEDWFESTFIIMLAIVSAISFAVFVIWELTDDNPIVDLRIFRHRNFSFASVSYMIAYGSFMGGGLLVPLWLQIQMHYNSFMSGLAMAPMGLLPVFMTPIVGKYASRFDMRTLVSVAILIMGYQFYLRSEFNTDVTFERVAFIQFCQGFGIGMFFMPLVTIMLSDLNQDEIANGSGLGSFVRTVGGSFMISIVTYLWNHRAVVHHAHLTEKFSPFNVNTQGLLIAAGRGKEQQAMATVDGMITQQAFQIAFNEVFLLLTAMLTLIIVFMWCTKPPFMKSAVKPEAAPSEGH